MATEQEKLQELADAGVELASYASYAEIVGGIGVNQSGIRKCCDKVFALNREVETLRETTEEVTDVR